MKLKISSIENCKASELRELMILCQPYVKVRDDADYWIFQRFFKSTSFIAKDENDLVGTLTSWLDPDNDKDIYIEEVAIHPNYRGQGIAQLLFENLEKVAKERQCNRLWLTCNPVNPAIHLWAKLGFTNMKTGQLSNGWDIVKDLKGPGLDRAIFEKRL